MLAVALALGCVPVTPELERLVSSFAEAPLLAFHVEGRFALSVEEHFWELEADVVRRLDEGVLTLAVDARVRPDGAQKATRVRLAGRPGAWRLLDDAARTACEADEPWGLGWLGSALHAAAGTTLSSATLARSDFGAPRSEELAGRPVLTFESDVHGTRRTWTFDVGSATPSRLRTVEPTKGAEILISWWSLTGFGRAATLGTWPIPAGFSTRPARPPLAEPALATLQGTLAPVRARFQGGAGKPRLLALFAPT